MDAQQVPDAEEARADLAVEVLVREITDSNRAVPIGTRDLTETADMAITVIAEVVCELRHFMASRYQTFSLTRVSFFNCFRRLLWQ